MSEIEYSYKNVKIDVSKIRGMLLGTKSRLTCDYNIRKKLMFTLTLINRLGDKLEIVLVNKKYITKKDANVTWNVERDWIYTDIEKFYVTRFFINNENLINIIDHSAKKVGNIRISYLYNIINDFGRLSKKKNLKDQRISGFLLKNVVKISIVNFNRYSFDLYRKTKLLSKGVVVFAHSIKSSGWVWSVGISDKKLRTFL